jgi:L-ribulose-5-phosphate 4-epimerase
VLKTKQSEVLCFRDGKGVYPFMMTGKYIGYKKDVLNACLWLSQQGYLGSLKGSTGNVSVRIDGETSMAITPTGVKYQDMSDDDICVVGFDLAMIEWKSGRKPSMEAGLHSVIYRTRPDVNAIVHTHQTYGSVFAVINTPIPALFDEVALSLGGTLDQAMLNAELLEKNAHVYWMALSSGKPVTLLPESTIERIGAMRKAEK